MIGLIHPDELLGEILFPVVSLSVGIIMFEGGLSLKLADLRGAVISPAQAIAFLERDTGVTVKPD